MPDILLVEDNEMNREMLSRRLVRKGYTVRTAGDAQAVDDEIARRTPDLILMDISLPGKDGHQITRELKANPQTASIPIIALTAHAMSTDRDKALAAGCDEYDTKPVELPRLIEKINLVLGRRRIGPGEAG
jgi:two-component system, cell cycle response regulator DivK